MTQKITAYPHEAVEELTRLIVPEGAAGDDRIELTISFGEAGLNVRDLSGYLEFIDRAYGRLVSEEFRSYAQRPTEQIQVTEFRPGSVEMIFQEVLANADKVSSTILVGILLKYLPAAIESLAAAFKDFEEARLIRLRREKLRKKLQQDQELKRLSSDSLEQLVVYLDMIYQLEHRNLPPARRFAEKYMQLLQISVKKNQFKE